MQSIRENGVLTPVLGHRDDHGTVTVRAGQRRVFAAREAGLTTIPVYLVDADDVTAERIVQQMVENDQREALTDGDRAAAFQQLAFEGLSVTAIARRTGTKTKEVKTALAVTENQVAATAIQEHQLTLDQAAVLIEFDDDDEIRADLIEVATTDPAQFAHAAQRARDEKARATIKADAEAELAGRGYTILDTDPGYYDTEYTRISELLTAEDQRVTVEHIENVDGRAAHVRVYADGDANITYFLHDAKAAGFHTYGGSQSKSGPMTDEQKAERRTLIANNKAWASAEVVRREWLTTLLSRKTLPKDAAVVIAKGLTIHRQAISTATRDGNELAHQLLGIEPIPVLRGRQARRPDRADSGEGAARRPRDRARSLRERHQQADLALPHPPPTPTTSPSSPPGDTASATSNRSSPACETRPSGANGDRQRSRDDEE